MAWGLSTRSPVVFDVLRDRNPTFVRLHDGAIRDGYTLKIDNRSPGHHVFAVTLDGLPGHTLKAPGEPPTAGPLTVDVAADQMATLRVLVTAPARAVPGPTTPVTFQIKSDTVTVAKRSVFLAGDSAAP